MDTDQVVRYYCESCRARYGLPEAIGAPLGGFAMASCEFCRRERECHVVEEQARVQAPSEESMNQLVFDWKIREDRTRELKANPWWLNGIRFAGKK